MTGLAAAIFLFIASHALAAEAPPASAPVVLTLESSVETALNDATAVLKGENDLDLTGEQVVQGYAQFLPNLAVHADYGYQSGTSLVTFNGASTLDKRSRDAGFVLSGTLNLFNGISDYGGLKSALARRNSSAHSLAWARRQVALDITQSYLQLILDQQLLDTSRKNLEASQSRLKLLQAQSQVGAAAVSDLYRQQAQTSSDELSVSSYVSRYQDDQVILIRKLRVNPQRKYEFQTPDLEPSRSALGKQELDALLSEAFSHRDDLRASEMKAKSTGWDVIQSKSGYLPRLDLVFFRDAEGTYLNHQQVNGVNTLPPTQQELFSQLGNQVVYGIGLNLSWNLFDRFATRLNVARTTIARDNAEIDLADNRLQVESDVRIAHNEYRIALRQVSTARTGLEAAEKAFEAVSGRYRVGQSSFIDVLTSQSALFQARTNRIQSVVNLKLREKTLEYVVGR